MKTIFLLLSFLLFSLTAQSWTLNNNFGASFEDSKVNVFVDAGTVCPTNGLTPNELQSLIAPAVNNFWNEVPTSSLRLEAAGFAASVSTMNEGRLCSPTDDECITAGTAAGNSNPARGLIPAVTDIVIACNSNALNFGGGNVLAVTIPNRFSGRKIKGAVILINETSTSFGNLSRSDQIAVIAHEIGHAIGLGHSKDTAALMYYRTVNLRNNLGQDDVDGVSFLYPMRGDLYGLSDEGILGGCGTISTDLKPPGTPPALITGSILAFFILVFEGLRKLKRSKARSSL